MHKKLLEHHCLHWLPDKHNPSSRAVHHEKLVISQLVKKFLAFCETRWFIATFTTAHHLSLSWVRSIQSMLYHPISWRCILIHSFHLRLGLPCGLLPLSFLTKTPYTTLISHTCPTHLTLLHFITQIFGADWKLWSSSMCSCLQFPVNSSLLDPHVFNSTLFWNTLGPRSPLSVTDQASHP